MLGATATTDLCLITLQQGDKAQNNGNCDADKGQHKRFGNLFVGVFAVVGLVVRLGLFELDNHHDVVYHRHCRKYCAPFVVRCSGKAEKRRQAGNHQACNGDDCAPSFGCLFLFEELFVYGVGVVIVTVVQVVVDCVRLAVDVYVDGENGHQVRRNVPVHRFVGLPTAGQFVLDNALQCALVVVALPTSLKKALSRSGVSAISL